MQVCVLNGVILDFKCLSQSDNCWEVNTFINVGYLAVRKVLEDLHSVLAVVVSSIWHKSGFGFIVGWKRDLL